MNSPCAMLITPICPKMIARPSAIKRNTEKRISPAKPCIARIEPNSPNVYPPSICGSCGVSSLLPLPACLKGVYARLRRAMERVGVRVRFHKGGLAEGEVPLQKAQTRGEAPPPRAPERAGPSPQPGRGEGVTD